MEEEMFVKQGFFLFTKLLHKGIHGITKGSHDGKGCGSNRHLTIDGRNET